MAAALTCYKKLRIEPLLPKRECRLRYPGRKPLPDRQVLCGILYVLHTDIPWEYLPRELGSSGARVRFGHDVLAPAAGLERGRGLAAAARGTARRAARGREVGLVPLRGRLSPRQGVKGGLATGPSPVDRARVGSKHRLTPTDMTPRWL